MELKESAITILINRDRTTIELHDKSSGQVFAVVTLTPDQLSQALSRTSYTDCHTIVANLDTLNKKMENIRYEFEIPDRRLGKGELTKLCSKSMPVGWISDDLYESQDSFFTRDGKQYARVTIRRWVAPHS